MQDTSYIERFIEKDFHDWKDNWADSRTLLVKGCRQVGKTTSVRHFAAENYKYVIYVDVRSETDLSLLESASESNVVERLTAFCEAHSEMHAFINSPDTVLILDEVQESKAIYERIRTFNRSLDCHVIFTGSNLKLAQDYFQPAGDCISMTMYPLSFEEYINYFGGYEYYQKNSISTICKEKYQWFQDLYSVYLRVGGYPEIFKSYVNGKQLDMQFEVLLDSFKSELRTRTAEICDFDKIDTMFYTICEVLCREKKGNARIVEVTSKLTEQVASKRISTKECNNILSWLQSANIINFCDKKDLATGELYSSERFYFEDLGLFCYLCRKYQIDASAVLGIAAETFVFKQLYEMHFIARFYGDRPAFAVKNQYELDFIVTSKIDRQTYGIEVKAGNNTAISLKKMLQTKDIDFAILAKGDAKVGEKEKIYTLPIFLVSKFTFDKGKAVKEDEPKRMDFFK